MTSKATAFESQPRRFPKSCCVTEKQHPAQIQRASIAVSINIRGEKFNHFIYLGLKSKHAACSVKLLYRPPQSMMRLLVAGTVHNFNYLAVHLEVGQGVELALQEASENRYGTPNIAVLMIPPFRNLHGWNGQSCSILDLTG